MTQAAPPQLSGRLAPITGLHLLRSLHLDAVAAAAAPGSHTEQPGPAPSGTGSGQQPAAAASSLSAPPHSPGSAPEVSVEKRRRPIVAPTVLGRSCAHGLRAHLAGLTNCVFDIVAGRRRADDLRRLHLDARTHAALLTIVKNGYLRGATMKSFHPSFSGHGDRVEFLGSCAMAGRVRAFAGTFRQQQHKSGGNQETTWMLTAFRVI